MARIRTIKPDIGESKDIAKLSFPARYFFLLLLCHLDDEGRAEWLPRKLLGAMYAHDEDVQASNLEDWLDECARAGLLVRYAVGENLYICSPTFTKHQSISKKQASKVPPPPSVPSPAPRQEQNEPKPAPFREPSDTVPIPFRESSRSGMALEEEVGKGKGKGNGKGTTTSSTARAPEISVSTDPPWWKRDDHGFAEARDLANRISQARNSSGELLFGPEELAQIDCERVALRIKHIDPEWEFAPADLDIFAGQFANFEKPKCGRAPLALYQSNWLPNFAAKVRERKAQNEQPVPGLANVKRGRPNVIDRVSGALAILENESREAGNDC